VNFDGSFIYVTMATRLRLVPHSPSVLQRVIKSDGTRFGCNNVYDNRSKGWGAEHGATHWEWAV